MIDQIFEFYIRARKWTGSWNTYIFSDDDWAFGNCVSKNLKEFYVFSKLQGNFDAKILKIYKKT